MKVKLYPHSYFNTGTTAMKALVEVLAAVAKREGTTEVLEVGCGTGIIGQMLSKHSKEVYGIDTESAVEDALENADMNGIKNCYYFGGNTVVGLSEVSKLLSASSNALAIVNSTGADVLSGANVLKEVCQMAGIKTLAYVSVFSKRCWVNMLELLKPQDTKPTFSFLPYYMIPIDFGLHSYSAIVVMKHIEKNFVSELYDLPNSISLKDTYKKETGVKKNLILNVNKAIKMGDKTKVKASLTKLREADKERFSVARKPLWTAKTALLKAKNTVNTKLLSRQRIEFGEARRKERGMLADSRRDIRVWEREGGDFRKPATDRGPRSQYTGHSLGRSRGSTDHRSRSRERAGGIFRGHGHYPRDRPHSRDRGKISRERETNKHTAPTRKDWNDEAYMNVVYRNNESIIEQDPKRNVWVREDGLITAVVEGADGKITDTKLGYSDGVQDLRSLLHKAPNVEAQYSPEVDSWGNVISHKDGDLRTFLQVKRTSHQHPQASDTALFVGDMEDNRMFVGNNDEQQQLLLSGQFGTHFGKEFRPARHDAVQENLDLKEVLQDKRTQLYDSPTFDRTNRMDFHYPHATETNYRDISFHRGGNSSRDRKSAPDIGTRENIRNKGEDIDNFHRGYGSLDKDRDNLKSIDTREVRTNPRDLDLHISKPNIPRADTLDSRARGVNAVERYDRPGFRDSDMKDLRGNRNIDATRNLFGQNVDSRDNKFKEALSVSSSKSQNRTNVHNFDHGSNRSRGIEVAETQEHNKNRKFGNNQSVSTREGVNFRGHNTPHNVGTIRQDNPAWYNGPQENNSILTKHDIHNNRPKQTVGIIDRASHGNMEAQRYNPPARNADSHRSDPPARNADSHRFDPPGHNTDSLQYGHLARSTDSQRFDRSAQILNSQGNVTSEYNDKRALGGVIKTRAPLDEKTRLQNQDRQDVGRPLWGDSELGAQARPLRSDLGAFGDKPILSSDGRRYSSSDRKTNMTSRRGEDLHSRTGHRGSVESRVRSSATSVNASRRPDVGRDMKWKTSHRESRREDADKTWSSTHRETLTRDGTYGNLSGSASDRYRLAETTATGRATMNQLLRRPGEIDATMNVSPSQQLLLPRESTLFSKPFVRSSPNRSSFARTTNVLQSAEGVNNAGSGSYTAGVPATGLLQHLGAGALFGVFSSLNPQSNLASGGGPTNRLDSESASRGRTYR